MPSKLRQFQMPSKIRQFQLDFGITFSIDADCPWSLKWEEMNNAKTQWRPTSDVPACGRPHIEPPPKHWRLHCIGGSDASQHWHHPPRLLTSTMTFNLPNLTVPPWDNGASMLIAIFLILCCMGNQFQLYHQLHHYVTNANFVDNCWQYQATQTGLEKPGYLFEAKGFGFYLLGLACVH